MKKMPPNYKCRKCLRDDFKKMSEFTKHLNKCKGPLPTGHMETALSMMGTMHKTSEGAKLRSDLVTASQKAGELKDVLDSLIKRLK